MSYKGKITDNLEENVEHKTQAQKKESEEIQTAFEHNAAVSRQVDSKAWLSLFGLKKNNIDKLSVLQNIGFLMKEDYDRCLGKYVKSSYGDGLFVRIRNDRTGDVYNVTARRSYIKQLKIRIMQAVDLYKSRLTWLTSGCRSVFGVLQEHSAIFLIDIKTQSTEIFSNFIRSFKHLITGQIANMKMFNVIRCQDKPFSFSDKLVIVDDCSLRNLLEWARKIERLTAFSVNCTSECLSRINKLKMNFEAIYLITEGESSMTAPGLLESVVKSLKYPLHIVSYRCESMKTIEYLHNLCAYTGGRFHAYCVNMHIPLYSPSCWDAEQFQQSLQVNTIEYGGPPKGWGQQEDCILIFEELEEARSILQRIEQVLRDFESTPNSIIQENNNFSSKNSQHTSITHNYDEYGWKREEHMSSKEWLTIHGLKAQRLDFYDLLASISFKHCDGVVNVLKPPAEYDKTKNLFITTRSEDDDDINRRDEDFEISSQPETKVKNSSAIWTSDAIVQPRLINAQYCSNFVHVRAKDGTIVHVQVTQELYRSYSRRMQSRLNAIRHRLNFLRQGSRELFGTITEDDVYVLIDTSTSMLSCIEFVKEKLLQLIYEQLKYKNRLNLIAFNSIINAWSSHLQSTTEGNLKSAMKWIEKLTCGGSTNTLRALQFALEDNLTQGIYLLTDGRPDQEPQKILLSMHLNHRIPIHTISFNCNDTEANEFLIQLAQESGGRFHYYNRFPNDLNRPEQWESEDIRRLENEYQLGLDNLEKLAQLRDECHLLRMKSTRNNNKEPTPLRKKSSSKCFSYTSNTDTTNSIKDSISSIKPKQSRRKLCTATQSTHNSNSSSRRKCLSPTIDTINERGSQNFTTRKQSIRKIFSDSCYPNLHNLSVKSRDDDDFLLYETKQLLDRQTQRYNEAIREEILISERQEEEANLNEPSRRLYTISEWLSQHSLANEKVRFNDLLKSFTVRLRPKYIPALGHHVVSEVLKQTLPVAYVSMSKSSKSPEICLMNPLAINVGQYEKKLTSVLFTIEKKLIEIVFQYLDNESLAKLRKNVHLDIYKKWHSKLCWYQDHSCIVNTFEAANWPFPHDEFLLLTKELDLGQKYFNQARKLKSKQKSNNSYKIPVKNGDSPSPSHAPCGHAYRLHH
uniref:VWFA domain-containing protein n=1 Tax=Trichobilharzia regenti TaxID=157069 RepID=A0AA85KI85_TRIRE|nr:unnamed protein product [Trichobilharzia regenti]